MTAYRRNFSGYELKHTQRAFSNGARRSENRYVLHGRRLEALKKQKNKNRIRQNAHLGVQAIVKAAVTGKKIA